MNEMKMTFKLFEILAFNFRGNFFAELHSTHRGESRMVQKIFLSPLGLQLQASKNFQNKKFSLKDTFSPLKYL